MISKKAYHELEQQFKSEPDAWLYVRAMLEYYHAIDDIIDNKITDYRFIIKTFAKASSLYSCRFYQAHAGHLWMVEQMVIEQYEISVGWEKSVEEWKKQHGDCLRHSGITIILAVILLIFGRPTMDEWSTKLRELCHGEPYNGTKPTA